MTKQQLRNRYKEVHSKPIADYVLGLKKLPSKEEFVLEYVRQTSRKEKPSKKKKTARRNYEFIVENGIV